MSHFSSESGKSAALQACSLTGGWARCHAQTNCSEELDCDLNQVRACAKSPSRRRHCRISPYGLTLPRKYKGSTRMGPSKHRRAAPRHRRHHLPATAGRQSGHSVLVGLTAVARRQRRGAVGPWWTANHCDTRRARRAKAMRHDPERGSGGPLQCRPHCHRAQNRRTKEPS